MTHIRIEPQAVEHAAGLFAALRDARIYEHLDEGPPASVEAVADRIARLLQGSPKDCGETWLNWTVFEGDTVVGYTQATIYDDGTASLAYVLSPQIWGRSVAYAASNLTIDWLNAQPSISRIIADTEQGNTRSKALLKRLGFVFTHEIDGDVFYELKRD
ncbi:MAG: GNAT family N-acetyltransferase [Erythrobacter sp.]